MKVLMLGCLGLLNSRGGDRVQIENTISELQNLGIQCDLKSGLNFDARGYDLVHVFQLDWKPETYFYVKKAKQQGKKVVLSPIHHNVEEVKRFDDNYVFDFRRISKFLFKDQFKRDVFKNIYSSLFNLEKLYPTVFSAFYGFKKMQAESLAKCDHILVQTVAEAHDLKATFGVDFRWSVVPNGVSEAFLQPQESPNPVGFENYILVVGRLEPRKNQLTIIKAVEALRKQLNQDLQLVLVGSFSPRKHFEYNTLVQKEITKNKWIHHINAVPYSKMSSFYKHAKVCVSASWFETTGLTPLEALICGTNAVAAGKRAIEYLGDYASYCDPGDINSIIEAIKKELSAPRPVLPQEMKVNLTWKNAAKKTLEVYNKVLGI